MNKILIFAFLLIIGLLVAGFINRDNSGWRQPIAYNHSKHVQENGMECLDCHLYAEQNARASIPNIEVCRDCHEEAISESEVELNLINFIKENEKIPWWQVTVVPDYVYFSHRRHVKLGELECSVCHGDVGQLTEPITQPFVAPNMDWCVDCHKEKNVSNDCYACHH